ncbi:MAG TPA: hypothetical protein VER96_10940 [Polyangiaceae bacterium]|nr:hypothetical protein [Polyangiaceae bacterium]
MSVINQPPISTLRDLVGICQALHMEWSPCADPVELDELMIAGSNPGQVKRG